MYATITSKGAESINTKGVTTMKETKATIYDELSAILTDYEEGNATEADIYDMLVKIQNNWDTVITAE